MIWEREGSSVEYYVLFLPQNFVCLLYTILQLLIAFYKKVISTSYVINLYGALTVS